MTETNSMRAEVFLGEFRAACEEIRAGAGYPQNLRTVSTLVGLPEAVVASIVATMAAHGNISPARVFDGLLRFSLRMAFDSFGASAQRITEVLRELEAEVPNYELDELRRVGEGWETTERAVQAAQLKALDGALALLDALQRVLDQAVDKGLTAENPEL